MPAMPTERDGVIRYLTGDTLGCAWVMASLLPRTDVHNIFLLLAALRDVGGGAFVEELAPRLSERAAGLRSGDPEAWEGLCALLGPDPLDAAAVLLRVPEAPRAAFWRSTRVDEQVAPERYRALLTAIAERADGSFEGFMAMALLQRPDQPPDGDRTVDADDLDLLRAYTLQRLGEIGLLAALGAELAASDRPEVRFAAAVARARVLYENRRNEEAVRTLLAVGDLGVGGDPHGTEDAILLLLTCDVTPDASHIALVEACLGALAQSIAPHRCAMAAYLFAAAVLDRPALAPVEGAVARFVVAIDALAFVGGDLDRIDAVVELLARKGGRDGATYLDAACDRFPAVDRFAGPVAAVLAGRWDEDDAARVARLDRVAARAMADEGLGQRSPRHLAALVSGLVDGGAPQRAAELGLAAAAAMGHVVDDEEKADLVAKAALACQVAGAPGAACDLLVACLDRTTFDSLDDSTLLRDRLAVAAARVGYFTGRFEDAVAPLYEMRYRAERAGGEVADYRPEALMNLGQIFEFQGAFGAAQRYYWEPLLRDELGPLKDEVVQSIEVRLGRIQLRMNAASDAEYVDFVEREFGAGEPGGERSSSPIGRLADLTDERVRAHLDEDPDRMLQSSEQALAQLAEGEGRGGYLHLSASLTRALILASQGEHEQACDLFLSTAGQAVDVLAGLAAAGPVEDLREPAEFVARLGEMLLTLAPSLDATRGQACLRAFVRLRSLWGDLRIVRRDAGGDARSPRGPRVAGARRTVARLLMDGPRRGDAGTLDGSEYYTLLMAARRERDLEEIAGIWRRASGEALVGALDAAFEAGLSALGAHDVFVGCFRLHRFAMERPTLVGGIRSDGEEAYLAIVARRGAWERVTLGSVAEIDAMIHALPSALRQGALELGVSGTPEPVERLTALLVAPLLATLGGTPRVHVAGEGALADVPWPLLFEQAGWDPAEVQIVQSFSSMGRARAEAVRLDPAAVVIGRPDYGPRRGDDERAGITGFDDLATADVEAELVAQACGARAITRADAVPSAVLAADPVGVLHIASHGYGLRPSTGAETYESASDALGVEMFSPREDLIVGPLAAERLRDPLLHCGIALAGANDWLAPEGRAAPDTGILTGEDLSWCDLSDVDCVVLSACSSGVGSGSRAMGSRGMRFAALVAGADWIVASLWPVPDVATAVLVELLYDGLARGAPPPRALGDAQRRLKDMDVRSLFETRTASALRGGDDGMARRYLEELGRLDAVGRRPFAHPYYWSGFICSC